ncbi:sirohydrochlorin chelatase [Ideonella oryzae]|uniref:CbiX/SirB N-terminal domain-containing protein n=1 Tax=Ideonella oryzae TaxID=2937441 RepID=A0ABT1BQV9_9BURK|nr:CbiX/SirB N-terminal domain-containing protein [Ideonella oryzae]MCO5977921.1 CbiX/SirB N-terminal domain-containing protein [Ideonella oryzae]
MRGLILFAHGARAPGWAGPLHETVERVRAAQPGLPVRLAFLEFLTPTLEEAGDALVSQGCTLVEIVPLFLGAGGHVRKDLPARTAALQQRHPGVTWQLRPAVGESPRVIEAMALAALDPPPLLP